MQENNATIYIHIAELVVLVFSATLIPLIGWLIQNSVKAHTEMIQMRIDKAQSDIDQHKAKCDSTVSKDVLDSRLRVVETEVKALRRFNHWVGNTLMSIAARMDIKVEQRPDLNDVQ